VDARVLMFALLCTLVTGSLFGAAPAWLAARTDMNQMLKSSGRAATDGSSAHRLRNLLIVGEFAVALVLLTGAGLFVHGLQRFVEQDPGWRIDGLLTASAYQTGSQYSSPEKLGDFLDRLEQRLAALPGVQHAALCSSLPLWGFGQNHGFRIEGQPPPRPGEELLMQVAAVSPAHFAALEIRLREGRLFTSRDDASQPDVVVINEAMARRFWPGQSPIGKRIGTPDADHPRWLQIVGVVQDIRFPGNLSRPETQWQAYRPLSQDPHARVDLELRSGSPVEILVPALRQAIAELDSDLPLTEVTTARQRVSRLLSHFTIAGVLLRWFGALGLLLAALGIYGVISYFVVQRTNEIGIRMALGAQKSDVLGMVLRRGIILCSLGICLGLGGALSIAALLAAAMPELPGFEILSLAGVCVALFLAALFACWLPACRASRISPMEALRCD
jgi:putative ABC transport system permease protein